MSAAAAAATDVAPKKGSKKLIIIIAAVLALAGIGGGAAVYMMKKKAAEAAAAEEAAADGEEAPAPAAHKKDPGKHVAPVFLPLDPFTVNLADRDHDRYAQIGVTLEIEDAHVADDLKAYMPAIRNGILMVLSHKNSAELLEREGKEKLAAEILRESVRPLGIELDDEEDAAAETTAKTKKKKKKKAAVESPVKHVHFSNFIIQ